MNTKIEYMYRDADNYKVSASAIFFGEITEFEMAQVKTSLNEDGCFIPGQVGIADLQDRFATSEPNRWDPDRDHIWHEFETFSLTEEAPNTDLTVTEFVSNMKEAAGHWDEEHEPIFKEEMDENYREYLERQGSGGVTP